jgi:hypothetical protein
LLADSLTRRDCLGEYQGGDDHADYRTRGLADLRSFTATKFEAVSLSNDVGRVFLRRDQDALHVRFSSPGPAFQHIDWIFQLKQTFGRPLQSCSSLVAKRGVAETLESLGLKDHGTSGYRARAIFYYEPLLKLYKLETPSLFGRLMRDEGIFLDRADLNLFKTELEELLTEFGPMIWPGPD